MITALSDAAREQSRAFGEDRQSDQAGGLHAVAVRADQLTKTLVGVRSDIPRALLLLECLPFESTSTFFEKQRTASEVRSRTDTHFSRKAGAIESSKHST